MESIEEAEGTTHITLRVFGDKRTRSKADISTCCFLGSFRYIGEYPSVELVLLFRRFPKITLSTRLKRKRLAIRIIQETKEDGIMHPAPIRLLAS